MAETLRVARELLILAPDSRTILRPDFGSRATV